MAPSGKKHVGKARKPAVGGQGLGACGLDAEDPKQLSGSEEFLEGAARGPPRVGPETTVVNRSSQSVFTSFVSVGSSLPG